MNVEALKRKINRVDWGRVLNSVSCPEGHYFELKTNIELIPGENFEPGAKVYTRTYPDKEHILVHDCTDGYWLVSRSSSLEFLYEEMPIVNEEREMARAKFLLEWEKNKDAVFGSKEFAWEWYQKGLENKNANTW